MSNLAIFKQATVAPTKARELSPLAKILVKDSSFKRIGIAKGKFRRVVDGEQMGANSGPLNVIIVNALKDVSRDYYATAYDPSAKATLPDCFSDIGDVPSAGASNKQSDSCATCPQNIAGSGEKGTGRACRFHRRVAVIIEGDESGDIYSVQLASKSLFGKGSGNTHPFESYLKFLTANGVSIDRIVTEIAFDDSFDEDVVRFTPVRHLTDEEIDAVEIAQADPITERIVRLVVAQQDGVTELPPAAAGKPAVKATPIPAKVKQEIIEAPEEEELEEPKVVESAKTKKKEAAPVPTDLDAVLSAWGED